jgi:hypothetical protein
LIPECTQGTGIGAIAVFGRYNFSQTTRNGIELRLRWGGPASGWEQN